MSIKIFSQWIVGKERLGRYLLQGLFSPKPAYSTITDIPKKSCPKGKYQHSLRSATRRSNPEPWAASKLILCPQLLMTGHHPLSCLSPGWTLACSALYTGSSRGKEGQWCGSHGASAGQGWCDPPPPPGQRAAPGPCPQWLEEGELMVHSNKEAPGLPSENKLHLPD